jgi:hypothetical protein
MVLKARTHGCIPLIILRHSSCFSGAGYLFAACLAALTPTSAPPPIQRCTC